MSIGIIGQGFVGNAIYQKFKNYYNVKTYDIKGIIHCNSSEEETLDNEIVFICLPTPMNKDGSCHTGIVEAAIERVVKFGTAKTVVIKSTVPPGTCKKWDKQFNSLDIVFNPEFLTEANAVSDFENQTRIILGGPRTSTTKLKTVFSKVFPKATIVKTDSTYAEMVKYVTNSFLATKVSFANEMYQICEGLDVDYEKVIEYACYDERLGKSHWNVPGPDGDFGYGGHCFPKDVKALITVAGDLNVFPEMLMATDCKNNDVRKDRNWESMKGRAIV
ncbi:MAG: UDP-glucose/GDP-mannose dehydrogenase family protein [Flavobacteriales bacterium]|nr:UDP-glucose/GDP-mannose dehydrogenase family protein [Flavobacteriales bacterium]